MVLPVFKSELKRRGLRALSIAIEEEKPMEMDATIQDQSSYSEFQEAAAFVAALKACAKQKDLLRGSRIHANILKGGLHKDNAYVGNSLVNMYAKCGEHTKALQVLEELPVQYVVSWNALIAGCSQCGYAGEALKCFDRMRSKGLSPNAVTFTSVLKACGNLKAADRGEIIHREVMSEGLLTRDIALGNALVDMYAKCGALAKARRVLDELPAWDVVSWTALIAGYVLHDFAEKALNCYEQMQSQGFSPNVVTLTCLSKACGSIGAAEKGKEIHDQIMQEGLLVKSSLLGDALINMYVSCSDLAKAQQVFNMLPVHDVVMWTALIGGYIQHKSYEEALDCFERMQSEGHSPDTITYACILKACGSIGAAEKGKEIHAQIAREGLLRKSALLGNALIDMYVTCGLIVEAGLLFDMLPAPDVVSWTALIRGYTQLGHDEAALKCFGQMQSKGCSPNAVTFASMLKACGSIGAIRKGEVAHAEIVREELLGNDIVLWHALVDMYVKCGALVKARQVFDQLPIKDVISWNILIAGYVQHGHNEEALNCFEQMHAKGFSPSVVTYGCIMKACGSIGATKKGEKLHAEIARRGLLGKDSALDNALLDMYARCGMLIRAWEVFDKLPVQGIVSWTSLIAGYTQLGNCEAALQCFQCMQCMGLSPDKVTYTCLVDLFGRAGHFEKALTVIEKIPDVTDLAMWIALLNACQASGNVKLARWAFQHAVRLDATSSVPYIMMCSMYVASCMQEVVEKVGALIHQE